jgi:hypothetical protein
MWFEGARFLREDEEEEEEEEEEKSGRADDVTTALVLRVVLFIFKMNMLWCLGFYGIDRG